MKTRYFERRVRYQLLFKEIPGSDYNWKKKEVMGWSNINVKNDHLNVESFNENYGSQHLFLQDCLGTYMVILKKKRIL